MPFWTFSEKANSTLDKEDVKPLNHFLRITFTNSSDRRWLDFEKEAVDGVDEPWKDFTYWFLETDSEKFVFEASTMQDLPATYIILRKTIALIEMSQRR